MPRSRRSRVAPVLVATLAATVFAACDATARPSTPPSEPPSAAPTVLRVDQLSLPPAAETPPPVPVADAGELPVDGPPQGLPPPPADGVAPPPPPEVTVEYAGEPHDLAGFIAEYRDEFGPLDVPDKDIATAGARLCTYLQRHATPDGSVDVERAMTEADINEPGYQRLTWLVAFRVAVTHYCGGFSYSPPAY